MKKKISDVVKVSKKPGLFLCGCWFLYLALGSDVLFNLIVASEEQLSNRLLVTLATATSAAIPAFFACGMFSKSLFVGREPIEYYRKLTDKAAFWIMAGLLSIGFSVLLWKAQGFVFSSQNLPADIAILCGIVAGMYLIAGSFSFAKTGISPQPQVPPVFPQPQVPPVVIPRVSKPVGRVTATTSLQCCVNNDPIAPGQQVLECPFCKVKFHEQCARMRNIQRCPVCGNAVSLEPTGVSQVAQQGSPLQRVTATINLQCCVNNDPIAPGQQVLECPFCKVKFHEQCARMRNIQRCPVCGKNVRIP